MEYKNIKNTDLDISLFNLGTMMFGGQTKEEDSLIIMDKALDLGINLFDTANIYNNGQSEIVVGKGIKGRRSDIVLATKVGYPMGGNLNNAGLSPKILHASIDESLQRLNTDYVDIYYMHAPDYHVPIEESLEAMTSIIQSGKARYFGVSNFAAWQIADLMAACQQHGFIKPIITQNVYNPITRGIESELIPYLNAHNLALTIYNPIAAGLLAGKHKPGQPTENTRFSNSPVYYDRYWSESNFKALDQLCELADSLDMSILELTMTWCASSPNVTSIITGVSKLSQLEQNVTSIKKDKLTQETFDQFDHIWKTLTGNRFSYNR